MQYSQEPGFQVENGNTSAVTEEFTGEVNSRDKLHLDMILLRYYKYLTDKNKIEIKRCFHTEIWKKIWKNNKQYLRRKGLLGVAKGTSICLPHVEMLRILTGFNKRRKAILLLLQSALQTHLYLCKLRCLRAHMRHLTTRLSEMLTGPDLHPVWNTNHYFMKQRRLYFLHCD